MPQIRGKQIEDGGIDTLQLADDAVTNDKIGLLAVGTAEIQVGAVTEGKLDATLEASLIRTDGSEGVRTADMDMTSFKITSLADPTDAQDAATKAYVDALSAGLDPKESGRVATTAALPAFTAAGSGVGKTLTADAVGILTVDGIATLLGDRILVKDEGASDVDHGIYEVTTEGTAGVPFVLTRALDHDEDAEMSAGNFIFIEEGAVNDNGGFVLTTNDPITVDTTPTAWTQFSGAGQIIAGTGLVKNGNTIDAVGGFGIVANANDLAVDPNNTDGGGISGLEVAANGVRISTAAAGSGLTGGGGAALAVEADTVLTDDSEAVIIGANGVSIDADLLSIDESLTNITPDTGGLGVDVKDLAAIILGIDNELGIIGGAGTPRQEQITTEGISGDVVLGEALSFTPTSDESISLYLNGVFQIQNGTGTSGEPGFDAASSDYEMATATTIRWLAGTGLAVDMDTADILTVVYES